MIRGRVYHKWRTFLHYPQPQIRFEPTYRLEPLRPFRTDRARALAQAALEMGLAGATYSEQWATDACRILAAYITQCVKALDSQRYTLFRRDDMCGQQRRIYEWRDKKRVFHPFNIICTFHGWPIVDVRPCYVASSRLTLGYFNRCTHYACQTHT